MEIKLDLRWIENLNLVHVYICGIILWYIVAYLFIRIKFPLLKSGLVNSNVKALSYSLLIKEYMIRFSCWIVSPVIVIGHIIVIIRPLYIFGILFWGKPK